MNQWKVEVIALAVGGHPLSRLRVTWQSEPGWFARVFRGLERVERSAIFAGSGDVWHVLPDWRRASRTFEQHLRQFESRLIFGDAPTASNPPSLRLATTSPDPGESLARKPEPATRSTPALAHRVEPESGAAVQSSTVHVHSKAVATMHRRFRRIKLH